MPSSLQHASCKPEQIANTLILQWRTPENNGKVLVLVEGQSDRCFFYRFFDDRNVRVRDCSNCRQVKRVVELLSSHPIALLAIRDSDYDRLDGRCPKYDDLFYTDKHDYEMMCLSNVDVRKKLFATWAMALDESLIRRTLGDLRFLSYMKWMNYSWHRNYNFKPYSVSGKSEAELNDFDLIHQSIRPASPKMEEFTREEFNGFVSERQDVDDYELVTSHDFLSRLATHIKECHPELNNLNETEIRKVLHPNFYMEDFKKTALYILIRDWEVRHGKSVLAN